MSVGEERRRVEQKSDEIRIIQEQSKIFDSSLMDKLMMAQTQIIAEAQKAQQYSAQCSRAEEHNAQLKIAQQGQQDRVTSLESELEATRKENAELMKQLQKWELKEEESTDNIEVKNLPLEEEEEGTERFELLGEESGEVLLGEEEKEGRQVLDTLFNFFKK